MVCRCIQAVCGLLMRCRNVRLNRRPGLPAFNGDCRRREAFVIFVTAVLLLTIYSITSHLQLTKFTDIMYLYENHNLQSPCVLPNLDPFDRSILEYVWKPDPIVCSSVPSLIFLNESSFVHLNHTVMRRLGIKQISCTYSTVERKGDFDIEILPEVKLLPPAYLPAEVAVIKCYEGENLVYDHIHLNVDHKRIIQKRNLEKETKQQLSVYIYGFDSVSALNAERKLTKTLKYLREELHAYVFKGHTKIGETTLPNLVAMLRGINLNKVPLSDNKHFLWNNFSDQGYVTFYSEDIPDKNMATFRNFHEQPTDHYIKHFYLALRRVKPRFLHDVLQFLEDRKVKLSGYSTLCYGDKPKHKLLIEYLERLFLVYENKLKFLLSWQEELTHDFLNFLELADDDLLNHFKWLKDSGKLNNTVLILMSDHGLRVNRVRNTVVGRIEDRMPLFTIAIPDHLKQRYPHLHENLLWNTERLTTNFDVYPTLVDILKSNFSMQPDFTDKESSLPKGISLFRKIPKSRTCFQASINEHFCPCYSSESISINEVRVKTAAQYVIDKLNNDLRPFRDKCALLALESIDSATMMKDNFIRAEKREEFSIKEIFFGQKHARAIRILVVVKTTPSHGLFEATVSFTNNGIPSLLGEISRINIYGNQSSCIEHSTLRSSCFCMK